MKKVGLTLVTVALSAMTSVAMAAAPARPMVAMDAVESAGAAIISGMKKKTVDAVFGSDTASLSIAAIAGGFAVEVIAPSADPKNPNKLSMTFDANAKLKSLNQTLVSRNPNAIHFSTIDAGTIIDLTAEAVVDHLLDVPANPDLAPVSQQVVGEELTLEANGPRVKVNLKDGRAYIIQMDKDGKVLTQGF